MNQEIKLFLSLLLLSENNGLLWKYISDMGRSHCLCAPLWNKERPAWGFIIQKSFEPMKDLLPFNFISFTTALSLPFPEHKQIKCASVIHLLCYQTVLLLGSAHRPTHTHTVWHTSFWHSLQGAVISHHHRGIYFWKLKIQKRKRAGERQLFMNVAEHGARGVVKCTYFFVRGKQ